MNDIIQFPTPERATKEANLKTKRSHNESSLRNLMSQGVELQPELLLMVRFDALTKFLIGDDESERRLDFELAYEDYVTEVFEGFLSQLFAAKMTAGTGLVVPSSIPKPVKPMKRV